MYRSFTDRILGGVCGGLSISLHINVWFLRVLFVVLTVLTIGWAALVYMALWLVLPQESLIVERKRSIIRSLWIVFIVVVMSITWIAHNTGQLEGPSGQNLYWPVILIVMTVIFSLRQVEDNR